MDPTHTNTWYSTFQNSQTKKKLIIYYRTSIMLGGLRLTHRSLYMSPNKLSIYKDGRGWDMNLYHYITNTAINTI